MAIVTRQGYFDRAMRVLAQEGPNGLRIGRLCESLGVTSGSFYHHFGNWEGFVAALLEHWEHEEVRRIVELTNAREDPVERITTMKQLAVTVPHEAEAAIRGWATTDPLVEKAQRTVDAGRLQALDDVLAPVVPDAALRSELATLGLALLIGRQQLGTGSRVGVGALLDRFELLVRAHAVGDRSSTWADAATTGRPDGQSDP